MPAIPSTVLDTRQLLPEEEGNQARAEQVDVERVAHADRGVVNLTHSIGVMLVERWQDNEVEQIQADVQEDEQQLERGKLPRFALVAQVGKRDALEGVQRYHDCHCPDVLGMGAVAHPARDARQEGEYQQHKQQRGACHCHERRAIDGLGILLALVGKAEEGRLHTVGEDDEQQCRVGIHVGDDAIAARSGGHFGGI